MCSCVQVFVLVLVSWFVQKQNKQKRKLREEIKSSFFSRNSQLASLVSGPLLRAACSLAALRLVGSWEAYGDSKLYNTNVEVPARLT